MTMLFSEEAKVRPFTEMEPLRTVTGAETHNALLFDNTVPRHLVHRAAVSEVLITDVCAVGDDVFHVGAQWPRDHGFYRTRTDEHDPILLAESIRQAALAIAHRAFEVPFDWHFMTHSKAFRVRPDRLEVADRPAEILLVVSCHDVKRTKLGVRGMRMEIDCYRDHEWIGSGEVDWSCVAPATYRRLRGDFFGASALHAASLPIPVSPGSVGRERDRDVTIGATTTPGAWTIRVVSQHAVLFDHAVDHVPGMLLLEAARQAGLQVVGYADAMPVDVSVTFEHFVEHAMPATVHAYVEPNRHDGARRVVFAIEQSGRRAVHGFMDMIAA